MTFAGKINKIPEFYMIIARKIFFPVFKGGGWHVPTLPPAPVSYVYDNNYQPRSVA